MSWIWDRRQDREQPFNVTGLVFATIILGLMFGFVADSAFRANGLYGARSFVSEVVTEKVIRLGSRSSRHYTLRFSHAGMRHQATVLPEQYEAVMPGQRVRFVIVPGRFGTPDVYLDTPGLKLDPQSRVVGLGLIIAVHFIVLVGLFKILLYRASRSEDARDAHLAAPGRRFGRG